MKFRESLKYGCVALLAVISQIAIVRAQTDLPVGAPVNLARVQAAKADAATLLKAGDPQSALEKLRSGVRQGRGAASADTQVATSLCGLARSLAAEQHPSAGTAALLAVSEGEKAKAKSPATERAYLSAQLGELYEKAIGDRTKAREQYQAALSLDAGRKDAAQGLKRIARLEALVAEQARESAALRNAAK